MNFAFVACMIALCRLEYLPGSEDVIQRGQRAATAGQPPVQDGAQARGRALHPHLPRQTTPRPTTATGFCQCILEETKKGGIPLARWAKASP